MKNRNILNEWFERVWVKEEESAISELFKPKEDSHKAYGLNPEKGLDTTSYIQFHRALLNLIIIEEFKIDQSLENDDLLFSEYTMKFRDRANPSALKAITGCVVAKIQHGKILSANNYFDFLQLFTLLNKAPDESMAKCLQGHELRF